MCIRDRMEMNNYFVRCFNIICNSSPELKTLKIEKSFELALLTKSPEIKSFAENVVKLCLKWPRSQTFDLVSKAGFQKLQILHIKHANLIGSKFYEMLNNYSNSIREIKMNCAIVSNQEDGVFVKIVQALPELKRFFFVNEFNKKLSLNLSLIHI